MTQVDDRPRKKFRPERPERSRTHGIPPMRCTATAKSTGDRCRNWAHPGSTVCPMHGLTGAAMRKAEQRVTLAQLMESDPRHPWQVVLDATHMMDAIVRDFQTQLVAGETITPEQLDRLINVNQIRHHLATTAISTKAHEQVSLAFTRHLEMEGELVAAAVGTALDRLGLTEPWRVYALEVARRALLGDEAKGDEPRPPEDPVYLERVAAAIGATIDRLGLTGPWRRYAAQVVRHLLAGGEGDEPQPPTDDPVVQEYDVRPASSVPALEAALGTAVSPCDVTALDDQGLRDLGGRVLDELERRNLDG